MNIANTGPTRDIDPLDRFRAEREWVFYFDVHLPAALPFPLSGGGVFRRRCPGLFLVMVAAGVIIAFFRPSDATASPNFGFERAINPQWFPDDARQWPGYDRSVLVTDLSRAEPSSALTGGQRQKGKWKVLPFETESFRGNALSIYDRTNPAPVRLVLGATGWHAVYIGVGTVSDSAGPADRALANGARVKLGSARVYRRVANNLKLVPPHRDVTDVVAPEDDFPRGWRSRDVIQEQFLTVADLKPGESLDIAPLSGRSVNLMYVRLVPVADPERRAWEKDGSRKETRSAVGTIDGESWIMPYNPQKAEDLMEDFEGYQRTDLAQWWFGILGADITCYPTKVGTIEGDGAEDYPEPMYESFTRSVKALARDGINPLVVARQSARDQGREFHVFIRPQAWGASMPWEEVFNSRFYRAHPEWRTVDREGRRAMYLSFAVPQVRQQILDVVREAVELADPEGVGFFFNRGIPLMLWEKAFADRFKAEYKIDVMTVAAQDPRVFKVRAKIMTEYFRSLRGVLDVLGKSKGGKRYAISAVTFPDKSTNERYGLDIETWVKEGLVDQLGIAPEKHLRYEEALPPDVKYYRSVVAGSKVRVYPFDPFTWRSRNVVWSSAKPEDLCKLMLQYYAEGADGIAIWDVSIAGGYPANVPSEGNPIDVHAYFGHRELLAWWAQHGVPKPNSFPLHKFGDNEYSKYRPNSGY